MKRPVVDATGLFYYLVFMIGLIIARIAGVFLLVFFQKILAYIAIAFISIAKGIKENIVVIIVIVSITLLLAFGKQTFATHH